MLVEAAEVASEPPVADAAAGIPEMAAAAVLDSYEISAAAVASSADRLPVAVILDSGQAPAGAVGIDYHAGSGSVGGEGPAGDSESSPEAPAIGGWPYALVDPRLVSARRRRGFERILVTAGGGDAGRSMVDAALKAIEEHGLEAEVASGASPGKAGLLDAVMAADVAISAAGVTAYELACAGVPAGLIAIASNQERIAATFESGGLAVAGDDPADLVARLANPDTRSALADAGPRAIDGYGAFRVRDALREAFAGRPLPRILRYRPATSADSPLQLEWRNDPVARSASWDTEAVRQADHDTWFEAVLEDRDRTLLIVEDAKGAAGSVRLDVEGVAARISVLVGPDRRGEGIGGQVVRQASELCLAAHPAVGSIRASVRPDNVASLRAFERAGFSPLHSDSRERRELTLTRAHLASPPR